MEINRPSWTVESNYHLSIRQRPLEREVSNLPDRFDHLKAHVNAIIGVVWSGNWKAGYTVITIAQDFYPHTLVVLEKSEKNCSQISVPTF